jgi:hypothetical protein
VTDADLAGILLGALREVPGLLPARPAAVPTRLSGQAGLLAVDVAAGQVTMRLVATELPLPPLLARAAAVLHAALAEHGQAGVRLRLEVTDLDRAALGGPPRAGPRPARRRRTTSGRDRDGSGSGRAGSSRTTRGDRA